MSNAALDICQIERLRSGGEPGLGDSCSNGMSTSEYRNQLRVEGRDLFGMQIDHIVPEALGGADHPLNYRLITSLENQTWGAHWALDKCLAVGRLDA